MQRSKTLIKIGEAIRNLRLEAGISQEALAEKAEVDRTYVGGVERGERNVSILSLEKLCKALNISLLDFFKHIK
ncbi:MAG: helix-turn-helix transcriptional regulator [Candidatus Dojkabacteria bacterium]